MYHYRKVLILYYMLFTILVVYFTVSDQLGDVDFVAIPSLIYVGVTYFVAFVRIRRIHLKTVQNNSAHYLLLYRIARTALFISVLIFLGIIFEVIYVSSRDQIPNTPGGAPMEFVSRLFWLDLCGINLVISWFLHQLARDKLRWVKLSSHLNNKEDSKNANVTDTDVAKNFTSNSTSPDQKKISDPKNRKAEQVWSYDSSFQEWNYFDEINCFSII